METWHGIRHSRAIPGLPATTSTWAYGAASGAYAPRHARRDIKPSPPCRHGGSKPGRRTPLILQLCTYGVVVGSVHLGTYGKRMDLRAGSVSPSFSHGRGTQAERYHLAQALSAGSSVVHEVSRCLGNALLSPVVLEGASEHQLLPKDSGWLHDHLLPHQAIPQLPLTV